MRFKLLMILLLFNTANLADAEINVVTTASNAAALIKEIGGKQVNVTSLTKGSQDPHYVEAKPSYMMMVSKADLLVSIGLDLEIGWLPSLLKGARNSQVVAGAKGSLVLGDFIEPLEKIEGNISREHGDVHPFGNPHFLLDPMRTAALSHVVAKKLGELDPTNRDVFNQNAVEFASRLKELTDIWKKQIKESGVKEIFTYHKTLVYFLERMHVHSVGSIEPKPGVPPTPGHILGLIKVAKKLGIRLTLVENYFETTAAERIARDVEGMQVKSVPVSVEGAEGITYLVDLYKALVAAVSKSSKGR